MHKQNCIMVDEWVWLEAPCPVGNFSYTLTLHVVERTGVPSNPLVEIPTVVLKTQGTLRKETPYTRILDSSNPSLRSSSFNIYRFWQRVSWTLHLSFVWEASSPVSSEAGTVSGRCLLLSSWRWRQYSHPNHQYLPVDKVSHLRRPGSSSTRLWEPQISLHIYSLCQLDCSAVARRW